MLEDHISVKIDLGNLQDQKVLWYVRSTSDGFFDVNRLGHKFSCYSRERKKKVFTLGLSRRFFNYVLKDWNFVIL